MDIILGHRFTDGGRTNLSNEDTKADHRAWDSDTLCSPGSPSMLSISSTSSLKSLPSESIVPSCTSLTESALSLDDSYQSNENGEVSIDFPSYGEIECYSLVENISPPKTPGPDEYRSVSSVTTPTIVSRSSSPAPADRSEDDTALHHVPTRHVDYLTHSWHEEDLWATWKHLKLKQKSYTNSMRLENASWRLWGKIKSDLKTTTPETINWLKEHDVTWLYGPLLKGDSGLLKPTTSLMTSGESDVSPPKSPLQRRPILRRRSISEIFLQQSRSSTSSLLKEVSDAVAQASRSSRKKIFNVQAVPSSITQPSDLLSVTSSTRLPRNSSIVVIASSQVKKSLRFNDEVEQFMSIIPINREDSPSNSSYNDSDSDDGAIMMKRTNSRRRFPPSLMGRSARRRKLNANLEGKTTFIKLPSTTLKSISNDAEPLQTSMKHSYKLLNTDSISPKLEATEPVTAKLSLDDPIISKDFNWQLTSANNSFEDFNALDILEKDLSTSQISVPAGWPSDLQTQASKSPIASQEKFEPEVISRLSQLPVTRFVVCEYFLKGNCKFGRECPNIHILPDGRQVNYNNGGPIEISAEPVTLTGHDGSGMINRSLEVRSQPLEIVNSSSSPSRKTSSTTQSLSVENEKDHAHNLVPRRENIFSRGSLKTTPLEHNRLGDNEDNDTDSDSSGSERAWLRSIGHSVRKKSSTSPKRNLSRGKHDPKDIGSVRSDEDTVPATDDDKLSSQNCSNDSEISSYNSEDLDLSKDTENGNMFSAESVERVLDPMRQALVDRVMEEFWGLFGEGWYIEGVTECASSSSSQSASKSDPLNTTNNTHPPLSRRKRQREDEDTPNDQNGQTPRQPSSSIESSDVSGANVKFSCPFRKHDPGRYSIYSHRVCALSHWKTISRLKEHLYRCHRVPVHCKRCWKVFKTQEQLDSHLTVPDTDICKLRAGKPPAGITPDHERRLKSRKKSPSNQSDEERWSEIYRLLFPNEEIPSPYFEPLQEDVSMSPDSRDLADYEAYIRRELPRLVRSNIEEVVRRDMQPLEASLLGSLASIIESCQDRVFKSYREAQARTLQDEAPTLDSRTSESLASDSADEIHEDHSQLCGLIDNVFQEPPPRDTESTLSAGPYENEVHGGFSGAFGDIINTGSGYVTEQLQFCSCDGPCTCPGDSARLSSVGSHVSRIGFPPVDGKTGFNDWNTHLAQDEMDLMGEDFHWMNNI